MHRSAEDVGKELGGKVISSAVSMGTKSLGGSLSDSLGKALSSSGKTTSFLIQGTTQAAVSAGNAAMNTVVTNTLQSTNFSNLGTDEWFDKEKFTKSMTSMETWAGTASGAVTGFVSGGLSGVNMRDGNGIRLTGAVFNVEGIQSFNNLVGGMAGSAVTYAMTGNVTYNVASIMGTGILEMNLGNNGFGLKIGSGGVDISFQTLQNSVAGLKEGNKVQSWKYGTIEQSSTLNAINMDGYTDIDTNIELAKDLWNGKKRVEYADVSGEYGHYNAAEDSDTIIISKALLGKGLEKSAELATVLSHEGSHVYGNTVEGLAHFAGFSTYDQLVQRFNLTENTSFSSGMLDAMLDAANWQENDMASNQYWKLEQKSDGNYGWQEDDRKFPDLFTSGLYDAQKSNVLIKNGAMEQNDTSLPFVKNDENDRVWVTTLFGYDMYGGRLRPHNSLDVVVNTPEDAKYGSGITGLISPFAGTMKLVYGSNSVDSGIGLTEIFTNGEGKEIGYGHIAGNSVMDFIKAFGSAGNSINRDGTLNVQAGIITGRMGTTGTKSTGVHLDFWEKKDGNTRINPIDSFPTLKGKETPFSTVSSGFSKDSLSYQQTIDLLLYTIQGSYGSGISRVLKQIKTF